jgi:hypothetical protein
MVRPPEDRAKKVSNRVVDIFDEISDDLRTERAMRLLRRYGGMFILAAVLVLLGVAGEQLWDAYQAKQNNAAASKYIALTVRIDSLGAGITNAQRVANAEGLEAFAKTAPAGYRVLADLRAAGLYVAAGQLGLAEGLWNAVSADPSADPLLRQLADLLWAQHALGAAPNDEVAARLMPLTAPENAWHGLAQETQALLYLHEGKTDQAKALFSQIASDPSAPEGVRNRADGLLAQLNG